LAGDYLHLRLIVIGRVQGVFFRRAAADQARELGVTGWARNLPDGAVEIVAEGTRDSLESLAAWAHRGPPAAKVVEVRQEWDEFRGHFKDFTVR
jgi:acylphosphatase